MGAPAIVVHDVSKRYRLGVSGGQYKTARESMTRALSSALRAGRSAGPNGRVHRPADYLWALRDVSFEIEPGEIVGIIGRNGAGKTTILKVISRITKPTSGWAEIRGRVGSLLEVGTGFHPELTGRENVFLSGSILGMRRGEIFRRFDEIVEFADIEGFLDTPIKRYSSGMKVRLAFAVAAHLEPEILLIDEVLAVGDVAFQKKCLGKMGEVTAEGRTVVFVSHNMAIIQGLCRRGIFLEKGSVVADATIDEAIRTYLGTLEQVDSDDLLERTDREGWQQAKLRRVEIMQPNVGGRLVTGSPACFRFVVTELLPRMSCTFTIFTHVGQPVATLSSALPTREDRYDRDLGAVFECFVDELPLVPGRYRIDVAIRGRGHRQDILEAAAFFDVEQGIMRGRPITGDDGYGSVAVPHRWRVPDGAV
jgi:lipopolysaccharide transport system ATP-binding protein